TKTPTLSDEKAASAIYLLCVCRPPTADETAQAAKQFAAIDGRTVNALRLARSLVRGKEYAMAVARAHERVAKGRKELADEPNLARKLAKLNGDEYEKVTREIAGALSKATNSDEQFVDVVFLVSMSRFPTADQQKNGVGHLKGRKDRATRAADLVWAVL